MKVHRISQESVGPLGVFCLPDATGKWGDMYAAAMQKFLVIVGFCQIAAFTTFVGKV